MIKLHVVQPGAKYELRFCFVFLDCETHFFYIVLVYKVKFQ